MSEIIYASGKKVLFFKAGEKLYQQNWDNLSSIYRDSFIEVGFWKSSHVRFGYNTEDMGAELNSLNVYFVGMEQKLNEWFSKYKEASSRSEEEASFYKDIVDKLIFHLYRFAEFADRFGGEELRGRALELIGRFGDIDGIRDLIKRRIGENGKFIITKEDLLAKDAGTSRG